jgi:hypothetical protein
VLLVSQFLAGERLVPNQDHTFQHESRWRQMIAASEDRERIADKMNLTDVVYSQR